MLKTAYSEFMETINVVFCYIKTDVMLFIFHSRANFRPKQVDLGNSLAVNDHVRLHDE